jgi:hypothetical protein
MDKHIFHFNFPFTLLASFVFTLGGARKSKVEMTLRYQENVNWD